MIVWDAKARIPRKGPASKNVRNFIREHLQNDVLLRFNNKVTKNAWNDMVFMDNCIQGRIIINTFYKYILFSQEWGFFPFSLERKR